MTIEEKFKYLLRRTKLTDKFFIRRAFVYAKNSHQGQKRASGEDYIIHPLNTALTLTKLKLDSESVAAALLHDVVDDTKATLQEIESKFGHTVAFLVDGVSKLGKIKYHGIQRQVENLRKMFLAMAEDIRVVLIKLADRYDNMQTLQYLPKRKQERIARETLDIYAPIANRLGIGEFKGALEDLAFPYIEPQGYRWLMKNMKDEYKERQEFLERVEMKIKQALKKEGVKFTEIHTRAKHYWSLYQKLMRYEKNLERIYDIVALRVIVKSIDDCYGALGVIHKLWKPLPGRIKDYIAVPKPNGYQSIHTTVFCDGGRITEFQIRTKKMHEEAEHGIVAHWAYIEKGKPDEGAIINKRLTWINELRQWQTENKRPEEFLEHLKIDFFKNRIFIFTPKGDVIDLPEGASPIDFAYYIHSEIGDHCGAAKINGKLSSLSETLKNGDVVEIITEEKKTPSRDWILFVKTNLAKIRIRNWLKKENEVENAEKGMKILEAELSKHPEVDLLESLKTKETELLNKFHHKTLNRLLSSVGQGNIKPISILKHILPDIDFKQKQKKKRKTKANQPSVTISGKTGFLINLAKCCNPIPGDAIKAFITRTKGASIHRADCKNIVKFASSPKISPAKWTNEKGNIFNIVLHITAKDRVRLIKDISSVISDSDINIRSFHTPPVKHDKVEIYADIEINDKKQIDSLIKKIKSIKNVIDAKRK